MIAILNKILTTMMTYAILKKKFECTYSKGERKYLNLVCNKYHSSNRNFIIFSI